ncbi:MAG: type II toxin-antitoxin system RelE/ParE family toxin [Flavobacteriales bacterium]|nr:type II toxin-antitoxin system RelE/ParE family toxin [Flavobacteriales bacterium]
MEIVWTEKADETFDEIVSWIEKRFTQKEVDNFVISTYEVLDNLKELPKSYPASETLKRVRKVVIHPHSSLYYRVQKKKIELLFFWDNRRNPKDKPK